MASELAAGSVDSDMATQCIAQESHQHLQGWILRERRQQPHALLRTNPPICGCSFRSGGDTTPSKLPIAALAALDAALTALELDALAALAALAALDCAALGLVTAANRGVGPMATGAA